MSTLRLIAACALWVVGCTAAALCVPGIAEAASQLAAAQSLGQVIDNLRNVLVGLLVGLATLFATIGGLRLLLAGGDPTEAEAGKRILKQAGYGYGIAVLAPVLVAVLRKIVGA